MPPVINNSTMKTRILITFVLTISSFLAHSQNKTLQWINENSIPLVENSQSKNFSFLDSELNEKTILGLGEASHGTHEFYIQKAHIIKYLITNSNYRLLGFELTQTNISPINDYLQNGNGDLKTLMKSLMLYNAQEIFDLFQWIKEYNQGQTAAKKVVLFGFDSEDFWHDPLTRDKGMAEIIIKTQKSEASKAIIWSHNVHIAKDITMAEVEAMGGYLKQELGSKYYALGFDTYKGSVNVIAEGKITKHSFESAPDTFSGLFSKAKDGQIFISFNSKKSNPFTQTKNKITNIYSVWTNDRALPILPGSDFDAIVFIRETTASLIIE
ncbi:erythromycin esterase family protein [Flavobacterium microcysteis]|uniref:Erythromycin esterase family protein n=2 Tax=Flavobacterium microcysteis TaxID=2596891 RepID=A0A501Q115_9FLAO|nr:erythromycin esterase family protein [Flavobacterium microcysteis]